MYIYIYISNHMLPQTVKIRMGSSEHVFCVACIYAHFICFTMVLFPDSPAPTRQREKHV